MDLNTSVVVELEWKKQTGDAGYTEASLSSKVYSMQSTSCGAARRALCDSWQGASLWFNFYDFSVTVGALIVI